MPTLPEKITVDLRAKRLLVDGVEFPWYISEDGVTLTSLGDRNAAPVVRIGLLAETVEVIPEEFADETGGLT